MMNNLILTDQDHKCAALKATLGAGWQVVTLKGRVCDLPLDQLGIDVKDNFRPTYRLIDGQQATLQRIKSALPSTKAIYVATANTPEGEANAFFALKLAGVDHKTPVARLPIDAFEANAIRAAFEKPRKLNRDWIDAYQTRRSIDRLFAFLTTPALGKLLGEPVYFTRGVALALRLLHMRRGQLKDMRGLVASLRESYLTHIPTLKQTVFLLQREGFINAQPDTLTLSDKGAQVHELLRQHASVICGPTYYARIEGDITAVKLGNKSRADVLDAFWTTFKSNLAKLNQAAIMQDMKRKASGVQQAAPRRPLLLTALAEAANG